MRLVLTGLMVSGVFARYNQIYTILTHTGLFGALELKSTSPVWLASERVEWVMNHILLKKAKKYSVFSKRLVTDFGRYDIERGYWRMDGTGMPSVLSDIGMRPATKKADVETGEDMKGE